MGNPPRAADRPHRSPSHHRSERIAKYRCQALPARNVRTAHPEYVRTSPQRAPRNLVNHAIGHRTRRIAEVDSAIVINTSQNDLVDSHEQYRHGPNRRGARGVRDVGRRAPLSGPRLELDAKLLELGPEQSIEDTA